MKKLFYLASIAALAFSSCSKDDTTGAVVNTKSGGFTISASVVSDDATTRNYLGEVDGELAPLWSKTDVIAAFSDGTAAEGVFHQNVPFAIDPFDAGQEVADFLNQENGLALLGGKNLLFYYPWNAKASLPEGLWNARDSKTDVATFNADKVNFLEIKAQQGYMDGSFISNMAPSVGTLPVSAVEVEDGTAVADVHLQPVVDYLVFKAVGTRPIEKITLQLYIEGTGWLPITGEGVLQKYVVDANKNGKADAGEATRYYWKSTSEANTNYQITMEAGTMTDVVCHEENDYVFVVPGGILGANKKVMARFEVWNGDVKQQFNYNGAAINGATVGTGAAAVDHWRHISDDGTLADRQLENVVFYAQDKDENGVRKPAEFNPDGAVIIRNEIDFLKYMNEYDSEDNAKDAFICSEYKFDFSEARMGKYATQIVEEGLRAYVTDYLANGMPCIEDYDNNFYGNGAVIKGISKLQSAFGLFGDIEGTINDITFDGIEAADHSPIVEMEMTRGGVANNAEKFDLALSMVYGKGVILGSVNVDAENGNINKVAIKNAKGLAAFGGATVAAFNGVTFSGVSGLDFVAAILHHNADLDMSKSWNAVKSVKQNVFGMVDAEFGAEDDGHHVITIAKGGDAEYKKLAAIINVAGSDLSIEELGSEIVDVISDPYYAPYLSQILAIRAEMSDMDNEAQWFDDGLATSVVIGGVSYWTGDYIAPTYDEKAENYPIEYAEQLAVGLSQKKANFTTRANEVPNTGDTYVLKRDLNLNFDNNDTYWPMTLLGRGYDILDGNKKSITGFEMVSRGTEYDGPAIAPFQALSEVKDLTVNGVNITIETMDSEHSAVNPYIAGLAIMVEKAMTNVTVNGINFDAYDVSGGFNEMEDPYYDNRLQTYIGWVAGFSTNAQYTNVKANVVSSKIKGISGLVAVIELSDVTESHFQGCSLTTNNIAQQPLTDFIPVIDGSGNLLFNGVKDQLINAAGSMVGYVGNYGYVPRSIEFNKSGAPKFVYNADHKNDNNKIVVLYDDAKVATLLGLDYNQY